jgi:hypothetical protein
MRRRYLSWAGGALMQQWHNAEERPMSDQFHRHARQWHQQQHQRSVQRNRDWQRDVFRQQRERQAHMGARPDSVVAGGRLRAGIFRVIVVLALLGALAAGAFLVVRSGHLQAWFGSSSSTAGV